MFFGLLDAFNFRGEGHCASLAKTIMRTKRFRSLFREHFSVNALAPGALIGKRR